MKKTIIVSAFLIGITAFTSCKRDYICQCTNTVGPVETTTNHDLTNQYHHDAEQACQRFEDDANATAPGTTNCHI
jgi:hypothetical protein